MPIEITTVEHICGVIRRQLEDETKDFIPLFIVYTAGKCADALKAKRLEFTSHNAAQCLHDLLLKEATEHCKDSRFMGLCLNEMKSTLPFLGNTPFFTKKYFLAAFFINADNFETPLEARQHAYHLLWHGLRLADQYTNKQTKKFTAQDNLILPVREHIEKAHENMLADAFSAIMLHLDGRSNAIPALARQRSLMALHPTLDYNAELYPFPIAAEGTQIVYSELFSRTLRDTAPVMHGFKMAREIGYTYDDTAITQWQAFSAAAQEMAWMGLDKNQILSAAIFANEDPYMRAMAYLVAEILHLEPGPTTSFQSHNPFADYDINERAHLKACDKSFSSILALARQNVDSVDMQSFFLEQARLQNESFVDGRLMGWCGYALLSAYDAYHDAVIKTDTGTAEAVVKSPAQIAESVFKDTLDKTPLRSLLQLNTLLMKQKRKGIKPTPELITELCSADESMVFIAEAFRKAPPEKEPFDVLAPPESDEEDSEYGDEYYI